MTEEKRTDTEQTAVPLEPSVGEGGERATSAPSKSVMPRRNVEDYGYWGGVGRAIKEVVRVILFVLFPRRVRGLENLPKDDRPLIVCSNHISMLDPIFLILAQRRAEIYFMGKAELFRSDFSAWVLGRQCGTFPVSRGKGDSGALSRANELIGARKWVGIFPEGTRSKTGELGRFKSGASLIAAQSGAYVLPAAVTTKDQKIKPFRRVTVTFGAPLSPAELGLSGEKPNLRAATRAMTAAVSALLEDDA